jgi:hypothetical protein
VGGQDRFLPLLRRVQASMPGALPGGLAEKALTQGSIQSFLLLTEGQGRTIAQLPALDLVTVREEACPVLVLYFMDYNPDSD